MTRVAQVFQQTISESRMAFMPFVTAGDPNPETTREVLLGLRDGGADLIELGFPYSDPIADGPVIQASYTRALENGVTVQQIMDLMRGLKEESLERCVIGLLIYYAVYITQYYGAHCKRHANAPKM